MTALLAGAGVAEVVISYPVDGFTAARDALAARVVLAAGAFDRAVRQSGYRSSRRGSPRGLEGVFDHSLPAGGGVGDPAGGASQPQQEPRHRRG
jgi:hypothetical protein